MDDVAGNLVLAHLLRDISGFFLGLVGYAAHPQAERPERRDGTAPSQRRVLGEDLLWRPEEDEEVELLVTEVENVRPIVGAPKVEGHGSAAVDKHAVTRATHEERYRLVHIRGLSAVRVDRPQRDLLAALIEAREGLPAAEELFIGLQRKTRCNPAGQVGGGANEG